MEVYRKILIGIYLLLFFSNGIAILPEFGFSPFQPFQSIIFFATISFPVFFYNSLISKPKLNYLAAWTLFYIFLSYLFYVISKASPFNSFQQLKYNFLTFCILLSGLMIFKKEDKLFIQYLILIILFVSIIMNFIDILNPLLISKNIGRASGLYLNPNVSALASIISLIFCINIVSHKFKNILIMMTGLSIVITFSRAGLISFCIFLIISVIHKKVKIFPIIFYFFIFVLSLSTFLIFQLNDLIGTENAGILINRINFFGNNDALNDDSSYQRTNLLIMGIEKYLQNPLLGTGLGGGQEVSNYSYANQSTHNQFIFLIIEFGMLGFFLQFSLIFIIAKRIFLKTISYEILTFLIIYIFNCFFSHNMLDSYFLLIALILTTVCDFENEKK